MTCYRCLCACILLAALSTARAEALVGAAFGVRGAGAPKGTATATAAIWIVAVDQSITIVVNEVAANLGGGDAPSRVLTLAGLVTSALALAGTAIDVG